MTTSTDLAELAARTWERTLELHPTLATVYGDERFDDRLDDPGPAGRAALRALDEEVLAGARAIDAAGLSDEERITRDLMILVAEQEILEDDLRQDLVGAVEQQGHQSLLPELVQLQKADTPERLARLLARLEAYPTLTDTMIDLLAEGLVETLLSDCAGFVDGVVVSILGEEHHRICPLEVALTDLAELGAFLPNNTTLELLKLSAHRRSSGQRYS